MAFERFTNVGGSFRPRVSIRRTGQIGFSNGAIKKFSMMDYKYGVLFYDKELQRVGIKLTKEREEGSCSLIVRKNHGSVSAKAFLNYYGIDYSETTPYDAHWDDQEKLIVFDLKKS